MIQALLEAVAWACVEAPAHFLVHAWRRNAMPPKPVERTSGFDDPVYKQNIQRLIERSRKLEDAPK